MLHPNLLEPLLDPDVAAAELIRTHGVTMATIQALKELSAQFYFENPSKALTISERAYQLSLFLPSPAPALGRWTLANARLYNDQFAGAAELFAEAQAEYQQAGELLEAARMNVGYVGVLAYTGQAERAIELAAESEPLLAKSAQHEPKDQARLASLLMNVGICHDLLGQYEEALAVYARQLELSQQLGNQLLWAHTKHNHAYALMQINAFSEAWSDFQQAEAIFHTQHATTDLVRLYMNKSVLLVVRRQYREALATLEQAYQQLQALEESTLQRHMLTRVRASIILQGELTIDPSLIDALQTAATAFAAHGPAYEEGLALLYLARCYARQQLWPAAAATLQQVLNLVAQGAGRFLEYLTLYELGKLAYLQGQFASAISWLQPAILRIEALRQPLRFDLLRASFLSDKLGIYQTCAMSYARLGDLHAAFQMVEQAKARLLADKLNVRLSNDIDHLRRSDNADVVQLAQALQQKVAELDRQYRQVKVASPASEVDLPSLTYLRAVQAVEALEDEVQQLTHRLQQARPEFSPFTQPQVGIVQRLSTELQGAVALQFHIVEGQVWVFVVDATGVRCHLHLTPLQQVEVALADFTSSINRILEFGTRSGAERARRFLPKLLGDANHQLARLYHLLLSPVLADVPAGAPLLILPSESLYYVPFHALYDGQRYLIEARTVSYAPSATVLTLARQYRPTGEGVLLAGYGGEALNEVAVEIATLGQLMPAAKQLCEQAATTHNFLSEISHYRFVHIAAHAQFRVDKPILSALTLADRRLTLAEIAQLQLQAELVTLSGCETGYGQLHGDDLVSLAAGFLGAGARSLLVSLWRVEDRATAQLMEAFYRCVAQGQNFAEALRSAQLTMLNKARQAHDEQSIQAHPAFWAPFILIGDWQGAQLLSNWSSCSRLDREIQA